jgi:hypothetical protein
MMRISIVSGLCLTAFLNVACGSDEGRDSGSRGSGGANAGVGGATDGAGGSDTGGGQGTGGATGTGANTGSGGTSGGVGCAGADLLCEDFESIADGQLPTGGGWLARDPSCGSQSFSMGVSGENPRGASSKVLKVTNHSYASCRLASSFPASDDFWVRAFIYWDESVSFSDKEILAIDLHPPDGAGKDDPALRFGDRSKDPCVGTPGPQVTMIGLGGGEVTGCDGDVQTPKGEWYCFEAHVQQSGNLLVNTFVNGTSTKFQSVGKPDVDTLDLGQAPSSKLNHVRLGFFTHNSSGQGNLYIDDVAVSTSRIGCSD